MRECNRSERRTVEQTEREKLRQEVRLVRMQHLHIDDEVEV